MTLPATDILGSIKGWIAFAGCILIVAVLYLLIALALVLVGKRLLGKAKGPERAIETSKESVEALKAIGKGDQEPALEARPDSGVRR